MAREGLKVVAGSWEAEKLLQAGAGKGEAARQEQAEGATTPGRMDVGQVTSTNGLSTVAANRLDGWIAETLQPSTDFCKQVKQTVKQICDFLKEDCFETNIHVHKTVKVSTA